MSGEPLAEYPRQTALGSLCYYITAADPRHFQPANITFDLLPSLDEASKARFKHDKKARHAEVCARAAVAFNQFCSADTTVLAPA